MNKYLFIILVLFSSTSFSSELNCENVISTIDINQCAAIELQTAETEMQRYFTKSLEHQQHDKELVKAIEYAQKAWRNYTTSHCDSVYTMWREGTIRGVMAISCKTMLTKQRTHELWSQFLTFMDNTPSVLPEPIM